MALKAVTPGKEAYCSSCSTKIDEEDAICPGCGEELNGVVDAGFCGQCKSIVTTDTTKCKKCGAEYSPVKSDQGFSENEFMRRLLRWKNLPGYEEKASDDTAKSEPTPTKKSPSIVITSNHTPSSSKDVLWQLSEPLERILRLRNTRLENVDALIFEAKKRIDELEKSKDPSHRKEKARLKIWLDEISTQRRDLETITRSIIEMEKTFKNLLALQQTELLSKEESLKLRLQSFQSQAENVETEKIAIREREEEIERKEDELRIILQRIREKEIELADLEEKLYKKNSEAEEQKKRHNEIEKKLKRSEWMAAHQDSQSQLFAMKMNDIFVEPGSEEVSKINFRVHELEEQIEKLKDERDRLVKEKKNKEEFMSNVKKLLQILDEFLGTLPPEFIRIFARSEHFLLYEKILKEFGV